MSRCENSDENDLHAEFHDEPLNAERSKDSEIIATLQVGSGGR